MRGLTGLIALTAVALTAPAGAFERTEERAACSSHDPLRRPFFGDTHVHTSYSFDAWGQGTRNTPRDAYRFARGESIGIQPYDANGKATRSVQLRRPLDFAMVSDHAELLGETSICQTPGAPGNDSFVCRVNQRWPKLGYALVNSQVYGMVEPGRYSFCGPEGELCRQAAGMVWRQIQDAAEEAYDRSSACQFTPFVGYEWTGMPGGDNTHRNVVFRNAVVPDRPANYVDDPDQFALWKRIEVDCLEANNGCDAIAIPHNSNVSGGKIFTITRADGAPIDREEAQRRAVLERLVEVTQHKGDSECRAGGADELCEFETLPYAQMQQMASRSMWTAIPPLSFAREILVEGLSQQQRLGVNPFAFGLIGSTDGHMGAPGLVAEDAFPGHAAGTVTARLEVPAMPDLTDFNPGGLAVLWAEENSRDSLFEAMRRREAYGTSGPRITARFFGGFDLPADLCSAPNFAARGYASGVPMGGDLPAAPQDGHAPRFATWALGDPGVAEHPGTLLQRIQIVKGWVEGGASHEKVFEVAGDPSNGAGVDSASCTPTGPGSEDLCSVWSDPEFDPALPAVYYARVVENPSCRWNAWVCLAEQVDCSDPGAVPDELAACCDSEVPRTIQERAWTSPIWYTPAPLDSQP